MSNNLLKCAVPTCNNTNIKYDWSFYDLPTDFSLKNVWLEKCGIHDEDISDSVSHLRICRDHFTCDDFDEVYTKSLKDNAIPSRNVPGKRTPSLHMVREHVDAQESLEIKLKQLQKEKLQLTNKIKTYNTHIKRKTKQCYVLKYKVGKMQSHSSSSRKSLLSKVFSNAQIKILLGRKKVIWGDDDLAMAFSLRQMSSKECYLYLKSFLNLPLPALSCVQKWAAAK